MQRGHLARQSPAEPLAAAEPLKPADPYCRSAPTARVLVRHRELLGGRQPLPVLRRARSSRRANGRHKAEVKPLTRKQELARAIRRAAREALQKKRRACETQARSTTAPRSKQEQDEASHRGRPLGAPCDQHATEHQSHTPMGARLASSRTSGSRRAGTRRLARGPWWQISPKQRPPTLRPGRKGARSAREQPRYAADCR